MSNHITLRVSEEQLEKWDDFHERADTEPRNRTELIQIAVNRYIDSGGFGGDGAMAQQEAISTLQDAIGQLNRTVEEMEEDIRAVKRQTASTDKDVKELAHDLLPFLPPIDEERDVREYDKYPKPLSEYDPEEVDVPVTVDVLLTWLKQDPDVDPGYPLNRGDVEEALEFLESQYLARSQEVGGETRWVKEV